MQVLWQVGQHCQAPPLEFGGLGVLVLVDHVLVDAVGHQLAGLGFHPGRDEGGEVEPGPAIELQLVVDQLVGDIGRNRIMRQATLRRRQALPECGVGLGEQCIGTSGGRLVRAGTTMQGHTRHYAGTVPGHAAD